MKNVCKRNKTVPFLGLVQLTPESQDMAFKSTRNMPFSFVLQKLSSFLASSEIFNIVLFMVSYILITGYSILLFMNPLNFVAVILKVLPVNLPAALNFANVF